LWYRVWHGALATHRQNLSKTNVNQYNETGEMNMNDNDKFAALIDSLRARALSELDEELIIAAARFNDVVASWEIVEDVDPDRPTALAFTNIMRVLVEKSGVDLQAPGVATIMSTMIMGAKMYYDAQKVNDTV